MPSHDRLTAVGAALLVVDLQERLVPLIKFAPLVIANSARLIRAAKAIAIPVFATEQYPKGLGPTVSPLLELLPERFAKNTFHALGATEMRNNLAASDVRHVALCGFEAHVCIAQTAIELLNQGYRVQVPADGVASRSKMDWEFGLRRMERAGVVITTVEAILFEWIESSDHPAFKRISALIKDFSAPSPQ